MTVVRSLRRLARRILGPRRDDPRRFLLKMLPRHSVGAEIGVHMGGFSAQVLVTVRPTRLILVDPWMHETDDVYTDAWYGGRAHDGQAEMDQRYEAVNERFRREIESGRVVVHRGTADVLEAIPDHTLDWVYIDGNHRYDHVNSDLEISLRKVKPGGYITGDDYGLEGWWGNDVQRAVDDFVANHDVTFVEARNHQFVLKT